MALMMDVAMTVMYAVACVVLGLATALFSIMLPMLICPESAAERAAAERRAALEADYALAWRQLVASASSVELMPPVVTAVTPVAKKQLGYLPYSAEGRDASEKLVCAICLEAFEHGETCSEVLACRHLFHKNCIGVWMKTKTTCPLCRGDIMAGSERLSDADDMV